MLQDSELFLEGSGRVMLLEIFGNKRTVAQASRNLTEGPENLNEI